MKFDLKRVAKVSIIVILIRITYLIALFFQTEAQLTSPVIPASTILMIVRPSLIEALLSTIAVIAAQLFFYYPRFLITIIICGVIFLYSFFFHGFEPLF
jgi:hypothetical protein